MRLPSTFIKRLLFIVVFFLAGIKIISIRELAVDSAILDQAIDNNIDISTKYSEDFMEQDNITSTTIGNSIKSEMMSMKYILLWTYSHSVPFSYLGEGQQAFTDRKCPHTNCYVTAKRSFFGGDYTKFDVIAFSAPEIFYYTPASLPLSRSPHQKYVFASIESSDNYPLCHFFLDGFFNWTWTYKLDSDARWGYLVVRDSQNKVIGPNTVMHWMDLQDMDPVSDDLKEKLKNKTKVAVWFVSNCDSRSKRENFVPKLNTELGKYNFSVDIFGSCGKFQCTNMKKCSDKFQQYYFYLSFENSLSEDYVTEKVLHALLYNTVPVVYGGANYTRFMPDGMYLDARKLGPKKLAATMNDLIKNPEQYYEYFRWRNHYSYYNRDHSLETNDYCRFCAMLNDEQLMRKTTVYDKFADWWNPLGRCFRA